MKWKIDPTADKDYKVDLSEWLDEGDTINSAQTIPSDGLATHDTLVVDNDTAIQFWVTPQVGNGVESVAVNWITVGGRADKRTARFEISPT